MIDRSFTSDLDEGGSSVVPAIMELAGTLRVGVIAEGIEHAAQAEALA